jgi:hypothetical protein
LEEGGGFAAPRHPVADTKTSEAVELAVSSVVGLHVLRRGATSIWLVAMSSSVWLRPDAADGLILRPTLAALGGRRYVPFPTLRVPWPRSWPRQKTTSWGSKCVLAQRQLHYLPTASRLHEGAAEEAGSRPSEYSPSAPPPQHKSVHYHRPQDSARPPPSDRPTDDRPSLPRRPLSQLGPTPRPQGPRHPNQQISW